MAHYHHYLYGHKVVVLTDHSAVKAVLEADNPSPKQARWWTKVYGRGIEVIIRYRPGRENKGADALSRAPYLPAPEVGVAENEYQVAFLSTDVANTSGTDCLLLSVTTQDPALLAKLLANLEPVPSSMISRVDPQDPVLNSATCRSNVHTHELSPHSETNGVHTQPHSETNGAHTQELSPHSETNGAHTQELSPHSETNGAHTQELSPHSETNRAHTQELSPHSETNGAHTQELSPHSETNGAHTQELSPHSETNGAHTQELSPRSETNGAYTQELSPHSETNGAELSPHSETNGAHTQELSPHSETNGAHTQELSPHSETNGAHTQELSPHSETNGAHTQELSPHSETNGAHTQELSPHSETNGAHTQELSPHFETNGAHTQVPSPHSETNGAHTQELSPHSETNGACTRELTPEIDARNPRLEDQPTLAPAKDSMENPHQPENWPGTTIVSHPTTGSTIRHSEVHTDIRVVDTEGAEGADPAKRAAETELSSLLEKPPSAMQDQHSHSTLATEQERDPDVLELRSFPPDEVRARKMALQQSSFALVDGVLYFVDPKRGNRRRAVVPELMKERLLEETHAGPYGAHFSGQRMFSVLVHNWWWDGMFSDATRYGKRCPECVVTETKATATPHTHPETLSNPRDRCDGPATDREREPACCCNTGPIHEVAICVSCTGPESHQDCPPASRGSHPLVRSTRVFTI